MKTKVFIIIAMVAVSLGLIVSAMMENAGDNNQNKIAKELKVEYASEDNRIVGEFASKTACELLAARKENTCYSPLSLYAMLALTAENADGKTRAELLEGLGVDSISDMEDDIVTEVLLKGYKLNDRVIRPASVKINKKN